MTGTRRRPPGVRGCPVRRRDGGPSRAAIVACGSVLAVGGCSTVDDHDAGPGATLLGRVDVVRFCDRVGVVEVVFRAERIGCPPGDACDPVVSIAFEGTRYTCPATEAEALMGVEVNEPGIYLVEAVAVFTADGEASECFGRVASPPAVSVTGAAIEQSAQIMLRGTGEACPAS